VTGGFCQFMTMGRAFDPNFPSAEEQERQSYIDRLLLWARELDPTVDAANLLVLLQQGSTWISPTVM